MASINVTASNMSELTSNAFMDCLLKEGEDTTNHVKVEGVTSMFGLHPQRLEEKRELVTALLAELPAEFKEGWSLDLGQVFRHIFSRIFIDLSSFA